MPLRRPSKPLVKTAARISVARNWSRKDKAAQVVLVPTMGALHRGHAELIRRARRAAGPKGQVVVSVFVNPTQFGPREDFSRYPRPFREDAALCRREGVDLLFHPSPEEMYAHDASVSLVEGDLSRGLCGAARPGHFNGVCTVVTKLFNIIRPDLAVFGEKDWQQLAVIRRMVRDLDLPVGIIGCPTVREDDGLAMSSRNRLLDPASRKLASRIYHALTSVVLEAEAGQSSLQRLKKGLMKDLVSIPGASVDYAEIVDGATLQPLRKVLPGKKGRVVAAVRLGAVRLIDNLPV